MLSSEQASAALPHGRLERPYNDFRPPSLPPKATLALCATEAEVARIAEMSDLHPDALVVSTPQAACECELRGLDYLALEDFYDVTAFLEADEPMLAFQRCWADRVDAFAWQALPELEAYGLRAAGHYALFLKALIDTLYRAAFALAHLLRAAPSARIVYFDDPLTDPAPETLFFPRPVHAALLGSVADVYGVELAPLPVLPRGRHAQPHGRGLAPTLERVLSPRAVTRLRALRHGGLEALVPIRLRTDRSPEIVCGRGYDVDLVAPRLAAEGYRLRPLVEPSRLVLDGGRRRREQLRRMLEELWPQLRAEPFFAEPFRWAGVDLLPLADIRLQLWWTAVVPAMWNALIRTRTRFERHRPHAVLLFSPWSPEDHGALQGSRSLGIPTITHQHGGFEGNCEYTTYDLTDLRLADYRLVYGEHTASYFRERWVDTKEAPPTIVAVGSSRLEALRSQPGGAAPVRRRIGASPDEQLVLYVPGAYQYRGWYMDNGAYLETPYFQLVARAVEVFARFRDVRVLYKPFPQSPTDPAIRLLERHCPNVSVVRGTPLTNLFRACQAFVIDVPSTALLEALLLPKPVLAHADRRFVTLRPEARELLRRRATLTETPDDFVRELERFLSFSHADRRAQEDDGFLRAYGTHLDDGHAAERAAQAVLEIAAHHRKRGTALR